MIGGKGDAMIMDKTGSVMPPATLDLGPTLPNECREWKGREGEGTAKPRSVSPRRCPSAMIRFATATRTVLLGLLLVALSSQLVAAQLSTNNAQSACVEYGDCTTARGTFKTETQYAPVTPPAYTPGLATIINPATDTAYLSALAAAGATEAYNANPNKPTATSTGRATQGGSKGSVPTSITLGQPTDGAGGSKSSGTARSPELGGLAGGVAAMVVAVLVGGAVVL
ncbi:hypothetical protein ACQY0O_001982 [Thecaphora frezii]